MPNYYLGATELTLILPAGVVITGSSVPLTLDEVGSIISEFESEADGFAAAAGYQVPIATGATYGFSTMKKAVKNGAGAAVLTVLFPNMGGPGDKATTAAVYRQAYDDFRKSIAKGDLSLIDAGSTTGTGGRILPRAGGIASPLIDTSSVF